MHGYKNEDMFDKELQMSIKKGEFFYNNVLTKSKKFFQILKQIQKK